MQYPGQPEHPYYTNWQGTGLEKPALPEDVRNSFQPVVLQPEEDYKIDPNVGKIALGLGWDEGVDVDASAAMFDANNFVLDLVWWHQLKSRCGSVKHSGDDRTGEGGGYDEVIVVDLAKLPLQVHRIVFTVCIYSGSFNFSQVRRAYVHMMHGKPKHRGKRMCGYDLSNMGGYAMLVGIMTRQGAYWNFRPLGWPVQGKTVQEICQVPGQLDFLQGFETFPPHLRRVQVNVLQGTGLIARDTSLFREATSDPYFVIKFKGEEKKSRYLPKTLEPVWEEPPFDAGFVTEAESKALKITLYDYDEVSNDDFMGSVWIPGNALYNCGPGTHEFWFALGPSKKHAHNDPRSFGKILVVFDVVDA